MRPTGRDALTTLRAPTPRSLEASSAQPSQGHEPSGADIETRSRETPDPPAHSALSEHSHSHLAPAPQVGSRTALLHRPGSRHPAAHTLQGLLPEARVSQRSPLRDQSRGLLPWASHEPKVPCAHSQEHFAHNRASELWPAGVPWTRPTFNTQMKKNELFPLPGILPSPQGLRDNGRRERHRTEAKQARQPHHCSPSPLLGSPRSPTPGHGTHLSPSPCVCPASAGAAHESLPAPSPWARAVGTTRKREWPCVEDGPPAVGTGEESIVHEGGDVVILVRK